MFSRLGVFADYDVLCILQDAMVSVADENVVVKGSVVGLGLGVFAVRSFAVGDVILCESLVSLSRARASYALLLSLCRTARTETRAQLAVFEDELIDSEDLGNDSGGAHHVQKVFATLTTQCKHQVMSLVDAFAEGGEKSLMGIIASNCIPTSDGMTALFPTICRINHRCVKECV